MEISTLETILCQFTADFDPIFERKFPICNPHGLQMPTMRMCRTVSATVKAQVEALYIYWVFTITPRRAQRVDEAKLSAIMYGQ